MQQEKVGKRDKWPEELPWVEAMDVPRCPGVRRITERSPSLSTPSERVSTCWCCHRLSSAHAEFQYHAPLLTIAHFYPRASEGDAFYNPNVIPLLLLNDGLLISPSPRNSRDTAPTDRQARHWIESYQRPHWNETHEYKCRPGRRGHCIYRISYISLCHAIRSTNYGEQPQTKEGKSKSNKTHTSCQIKTRHAFHFLTLCLDVLLTACLVPP